MGKFRVLRDDYPDTDMESQEFHKFAMHEAKLANKIAFYSEINITILSNTDHASAIISHNLGYTPVVHSTVKYGTKGYPYMGIFMPQIEVPAFGGGTTNIFFFINWDNSNINIDAYADILGNPANNETFTIEAYIMLDAQ